jgi:hypothetical protein
MTRKRLLRAMAFLLVLLVVVFLIANQMVGRCDCYSRNA